MLGHSDRSRPLDLEIQTDVGVAQISLVLFGYLTEAEYWIDKAKHSKHNHFYYD